MGPIGAVNNFFCPLLEKFVHFLNILPVGVQVAETGVHFATFKFRPGKGVFWGGVRVFCVCTFPKSGV